MVCWWSIANENIWQLIDNEMNLQSIAITINVNRLKCWWSIANWCCWPTCIINNRMQSCSMLIDGNIDNWLIANGYCWKSVSNWLVWSILIGELLIYIIFIWLIYYIITKSNILQANWIYSLFFYWAQLFTLCYLIWNCPCSANDILWWKLTKKLPLNFSGYFFHDRV